MQPSQIQAITDIIDEPTIKAAFSAHNFSQAELDIVVSSLHTVTMGYFSANQQKSINCLIPINNIKDAEFEFYRFSTLFNGSITFHIYTYYFKRIV